MGTEGRVLPRTTKFYWGVVGGRNGRREELVFLLSSRLGRFFGVRVASGVVVCRTGRFPRFLVRPFCSSCIKVMIYRRKVFHFYMSKASFITSVKRAIFLSPKVLFRIRRISTSFQCALLFCHIRRVLRVLKGAMIDVQLCSALCPRSYAIARAKCRRVLASCTQVLLSLRRGRGRSACDLRRRGLLLVTMACHLYDVFSTSFRGRNGRVQHGVRAFRVLIGLVRRGFVHRHAMTFCTSRLYLAPGCLSIVIGSMYNGAIRRLVFGTVVHHDVCLVGGASGAVRRVTDSLDFPGTSSFNAFFGGRANLSPGGCQVKTR